MYGFDTGEIDVTELQTALRAKLVHIPGVAVAEVKDIGEAMEAVRGYGHGSGTVKISLVHGFFDRAFFEAVKFREKLVGKKKPR